MSTALGTIKLDEPLYYNFDDLVRVKKTSANVRTKTLYDTTDGESKARNDAIDLISEIYTDGESNDSKNDKTALERWHAQQRFPTQIYHTSTGKNILTLSRSSPDIKGYDIISSDVPFAALRKYVAFSKPFKEALFTLRPDLPFKTFTSIGPNGEFVESEIKPINLDSKTGEGKGAFRIESAQALPDALATFTDFNPWRSETVTVLYNPQNG